MKKLDLSQNSFIKASVWAVLMGYCLSKVLDNMEERGYELCKEGKGLVR